MKDFQTVYDFAMSEKWNLYVGTTILILSSIIKMIFPLGIGNVIDSINKDKESSDQSNMAQTLKSFCFMILGIYGLQSVLIFFRYYMLEMATDRIRNKARVHVFSVMMKKSMSFFDKNQSGELINILSDDTWVLSNAVTKIVANGLRSILISVVGLIMMWTVSPDLFYVALWTVPLLGLVTLKIGYHLKNARKEFQSRVAGSMKFAQERIINVSTVRAFGQERQEIQKFREKCEDVLEVKDSASFVHSVFHGGIELSNGIMVATIVYYGGLMLNEGSITAGSLTTFLLYAVHVAGALHDLSGFYTSLMTGMSASQRIQEVIETDWSEEEEKDEEVTEVNQDKVIPIVKGNIRFHSVSFAYPSRLDMPALNNINLDIPAGKTFAIFGASGSGKSTLAALILRLYDVPEGSGQIKLDGVNTRSLDPDWVRRQIGYVSQDPVLFSGTIRENILYGLGSRKDDYNKETLDQLVYKIAKDANALEFILRLPSHFDTLVGERGILLSGGQRQRIAIARALIKNPKILLFDEATSALDTENEKMIQDALEKVGQNRTVIIIAHRLSTIKNAHKIAVIDLGSLAEIGSYQDLMAIPFGKFKKLAERQEDSRTETLN